MATCFWTRFFMPSWWVRAFEASMTSKGNSINPLEHSQMSRMVPALDLNELNALSLLLMELQKQLLASNRCEHLYIDPVVHQKFISTNGKAESFLFEKVLQGIPGLRILISDRDNKRLLPIPLFKSEFWQEKDGGNGGMQLLLKPSTCGPELLLGYGEPYSNLCRILKGGFDLKDALGDHAPLALWRSVWLDFKGVEQAILLRLEQAMQWDFRWLRLDGVFGVGMHYLFKDICLSKKKISHFGRLSLQDHFDFLDRIGKRLIDHGLLVFEPVEQYLAMGPDETAGMMLVWKFMKNRLAVKEAKEYLSLVSSFLLNEIYDKNIEDIFTLLCGDLYDEVLKKQLVHLWHVVKEVEKRERNHSYVDCINGNFPLLIPALYLEWVIRQLPGHHLELPQPLAGSLAATFASYENINTMGLKYESFKKAILDDSEYINDLRLIEGATLTSTKTLQSKEYLGKLRDSCRGASDLKSKEEPAEENHVVLTKNRSKGHSVRLNGDKYRASHLRRLAIEELNYLKNNEPSGYLELKKKYMETLDSSSRRMIDDIQKRLQPHVFDDHLRYSLVKFMVENPEQWNSSAGAISENY